MAFTPIRGWLNLVVCFFLVLSIFLYEVYCKGLTGWFPMNIFSHAVAFGSQLASQPFGSSPGIGMSNFSAGDFKATNNQFFPQPGSSSSQSKSFDDWLKVPSDSANQSSNE